MTGRVVALYRHPVKGFTPEALASTILERGRNFPCDRLYAVERGPSGYDPLAPAPISKWRFAVLANHPELARAVTAFDMARGELAVTPPDGTILRFNLADEAARRRFADWLASFLQDEDAGPLRIIEGAGEHRFTDDELGFVSLINLASLRDLETRLGRPVEPLRMRANIYVDGWPPWSELDLATGAPLRLGDVQAQVEKPIPRCVATHVDPVAGVRDLDLVGALRHHYGHVLCGIYLSTVVGGRLDRGDIAEPAWVATPVP